MRKLARAIAARSELSTALSAAKSLRELIEREAHRDFRKRTHRTQADHSTPRAEALDVRIAISGKLFDGGVQGVHTGR